MPDLLLLFAHVAPGQILYATDIPFGAPRQGAILALRIALQAGLERDQLASVAGGQVERLIAGEDALDVGPAPGPAHLRTDPVLHRVSHYLTMAVATSLAGGDAAAEQADLARLSCLVGDGAPQEPVCRSILALLELHGGLEAGKTLQERFNRLHLLVTGAVLAATPDVPVS